MKIGKEFLLAAVVALITASVQGQDEPAYLWTNLAGQPGGRGSVDGIGTAARFNYPSGVAMDALGNAYVADQANHTIRKITTNGIVTVLAGRAGMSGTNDGPGSTARFNGPTGVTVDTSGNVFVTDRDNSTIRKIDPTGVVMTVAGRPGVNGSANGTGSAARFSGPSAVAVDDSGNLFVADTYNHTIRKVTSSGEVTTAAGWAGHSGTNDGAGSGAQFYFPCSVALDGGTNVYIADGSNHTIRKLASSGAVTTLAGSPGASGSSDGTGDTARFKNPQGVVVDASGNVYVADSGNATIRKVTTSGEVTTLAGSAGNPGSADGTGAAARFSIPMGVAVDSAGGLYVADTGNNTIRRATGDGVVTTLAGSLQHGGDADGTGTTARFLYPFGVGVDSVGNVYVADLQNETIRKSTPSGEVTILAGSAGIAGTNDGVALAARFNWPSAVVADNASNVYVADFLNHAVRKVTSGGVVTTLAGNPGSPGSEDGAGRAARFNGPCGIWVNGAGNLYVADANSHTIRRVTSSGDVTTLAGKARESGSVDGAVGVARFNEPSGVAEDSAGNVYVADFGNHTIRKITTDGVVNTLAGRAGEPGQEDGVATAARFNHPNSVAVDGAGNVYVADADNHTIRRVTTQGIVSTIGGLASTAGGSDGVGSSSRFAAPNGVAVDSRGCIYVADTWNNRISKGTPLPWLRTVWAGSSITLSWASAAADFLLQEKSGLAGEEGWSLSARMISDDGTNKSILVTSPTNNVFFRLVRN